MNASGVLGHEATLVDEMNEMHPTQLRIFVPDAGVLHNSGDWADQKQSFEPVAKMAQDAGATINVT